MTHEAIVLLGPTGSGKTPLGEHLERRSLRGRGCHHFDFGTNLRSVASGVRAERFSDGELFCIRRVLDEGALLDKQTFPIAVKILEGFISGRNVRPGDLIVLNGLPRHIQQAEDLVQWITVIGVVELECDVTTILERLRKNTGGDRAGRVDDNNALVARKLEIYRQRTQPLVEYYRVKNVPIVKIAVSAEMDASEMAGRLDF